MNISWLFVLLFIAVLSVCNILITSATLKVKISSIRKFRKQKSLKERICKELSSGVLTGNTVPARERREYLALWNQTRNTVSLPDSLMKGLKRQMKEWDLDKTVSEGLRSRLPGRRASALVLLDFLESRDKIGLVKKTLKKETSFFLRLRLIYSLDGKELKTLMPEIIASMKNTQDYNKKKILRLLGENRVNLKDWAESEKDSTDPDTVRAVIQTGERSSRGWFREYIISKADSDNPVIREEAAGILFSSYSSTLDMDSLVNSRFPDIRTKAASAILAGKNKPDRVMISSLLTSQDTRETAIGMLQARAAADPGLISTLFKYYSRAESDRERLGYAAVLSPRLSYFIQQIREKRSDAVRSLIRDSVDMRKSSHIIDFLNSNRDPETEEILHKTLKEQLETNGFFIDQCVQYLKPEIRERWELPAPKPHKGTPKIQLKLLDKGYMVLLLVLVLSIPLITFIPHFTRYAGTMTGEELLVDFLFHYHYIFAFYAVASNLTYLILMLLSWASITRQHLTWTAADRRFLFFPGVLPSISIIAPAYNEEKTIIQNVYSLLSLEYPELEVVVVNDGSSDETAETLINHFEMELTDPEFRGKLLTEPVKGVYRCREIPNLILIDKQNGGKADSLNAGINIASNEYICSIDADSLLEPDSLQKLMVRTLTGKGETAAVGGNIIPVNGSTVTNGSITEIHLPENVFARYQTIEYLRSFIAGRLGWAKINSLLIISGAFGVFRKDRILEIGGYLTGKGALKKDTVGEDMEVVVRLIRFLSDKGIKHRVDYAHNANCWTEVPEKFSSLLKQRDRWHRGLIEIMVYHKNMLFNRKYKSAGLVAFPYFYIFELLGPFLEGLGYLVLTASLIFGILSMKVFLFMFAIVVLFGIMVSSMALFLAEKQVVYFKNREFLSGLEASLAENFGYRQLISILRPASYISYLFRNRGWQKLDRVGFISELPAENKEDTQV